jgi:hypothetical protein
LRFPEDADAPDVPLAVKSLAEDLDGVAMDDQAAIALIPAAATAGAGAYYYATDTSQLFRSNGTAWVEVAPATQWRPVPGATGVMALNGSSSPGTHLAYASNLGTSPITFGGGGAQQLAMFNLKMADLAMEGRSTKLRMVTEVWSNGVAPGCGPINARLYGANQPTGSGGSSISVSSNGSWWPTAGGLAISSSDLNVPLMQRYETTQAILPTDGWWIPAINFTAPGIAATSYLRLMLRLEYRNV